MNQKCSIKYILKSDLQLEWLLILMIEYKNQEFKKHKEWDEDFPRDFFKSVKIYLMVEFYSCSNLKNKSFHLFLEIQKKKIKYIKKKNILTWKNKPIFNKLFFWSM